MRRRETIAGVFVVVMLTLGAAIMLHWRSLQPRPDMIADPNSVEWLPATPAEYQAAEQTINGQLYAFRSNDFQKASMYQSEMLRVSFETVQNFRAIIMLHYPQFCSFAHVKYGVCVADPGGNALRIQVMLLSKQGMPTRALYFLRRENGMYRVSGVVGDPEVFFGSHGPLHSPGRPDHPHPYGRPFPPGIEVRSAQIPPNTNGPPHN